MPTLLVAAAVLIEKNAVLLTQRKPGSHLALAWEFPGGKVESDEDPRAALARELREELGIDAAVGEVLDVTFHRYAERPVLLLFFRATRTATSPEPRALDVADYRWAAAAELDPADFPPADRAVLRKVTALLAPGSGRNG